MLDKQPQQQQQQHRRRTWRELYLLEAIGLSLTLYTSLAAIQEPLFTTSKDQVYYGCPIPKGTGVTSRSEYCGQKLVDLSATPGKHKSFAAIIAFLVAISFVSLVFLLFALTFSGAYRDLFCCKKWQDYDGIPGSDNLLERRRNLAKKAMDRGAIVFFVASVVLLSLWFFQLQFVVDEMDLPLNKTRTAFLWTIYGNIFILIGMSVNSFFLARRKLFNIARTRRPVRTSTALI